MSWERLTVSGTLIIALVLTSLGARAQTESAATTFDVVSVKPNPSGDYRSTVMFSQGSLDGHNVVLPLLILDAYGVEGFRIKGGPSWFNSDRFDVQARAASPLTRKEMAPMLRALLEDRFKLRAHHETTEGPVYRLTAGKTGVKIHPLQDGHCIVPSENAPMPASAGEHLPVCGAPRAGGNRVKRTLDVVGVTTATLSEILTLMLGRTVIDNTGVGGRLDALHLEYTPDDPAIQARLADPAQAPGPDEDAPDLATALREQIGLQLEAGKGPVDVLVIDHVEKPSVN